jgi:hypothetical protein
MCAAPSTTSLPSASTSGLFPPAPAQLDFEHQDRISSLRPEDPHRHDGGVGMTLLDARPYEIMIQAGARLGRTIASWGVAALG